MYPGTLYPADQLIVRDFLVGDQSRDGRVDSKLISLRFKRTDVYGEWHFTQYKTLSGPNYPYKYRTVAMTNFDVSVFVLENN